MTKFQGPLPQIVECWEKRGDYWIYTKRKYFLMLGWWGCLDWEVKRCLK